MLPGSHIYEMQEAVRLGKQVDVHAVLRRLRQGEASTRTSEEQGISDLADVAGQRDFQPSTASSPGIADLPPNGSVRNEAAPARAVFGTDAGGGRLRDGLAATHAGTMDVPGAPPVSTRAVSGAERTPAGSLINAFRNKV
jgi:hypothetical protein